MIIASGDTGIKVMVEHCQCELDGRGMPEEWKTSVVVSFFEGKGDVMSCGTYGEVKLQEHAMKIVERVLEKRIRCLVNMSKMQFGFMPGIRTIDALLFFAECKRNIKIKGKSCICVSYISRKHLVEFQGKVWHGESGRRKFQR